jgi:hypothetical protein
MGVFLNLLGKLVSRKSLPLFFTWRNRQWPEVCGGVFLGDENRHSEGITVSSGQFRQQGLLSIHHRIWLINPFQR